MRAAAEALRAFPLAELRAGVEAFWLAQRNAPDDTAEHSKLYLALRLLFAVPETVDGAQAKVFGGWNHPSITTREEPFQMLWPLGRDAAGQLEVQGHYRSYRGAPYNALAEFDYFASRFGLR